MDAVTYIDIKSLTFTLHQSQIFYLLKCKSNVPLAQEKKKKKYFINFRELLQRLVLLNLIKFYASFFFSLSLNAMHRNSNVLPLCSGCARSLSCASMASFGLLFLHLRLVSKSINEEVNRVQCS